MVITTRSPAGVSSSISLDKNEALAALKNDDVIMLDAWDVDEWIAESSPPYGKDCCPRKGLLPHAVWIEWHCF